MTKKILSEEETEIKIQKHKEAVRRAQKKYTQSDKFKETRDKRKEYMAEYHRNYRLKRKEQIEKMKLELEKLKNDNTKVVDV